MSGTEKVTDRSGAQTYDVQKIMKQEADALTSIELLHGAWLPTLKYS